MVSLRLSIALSVFVVVALSIASAAAQEVPRVIPFSGHADGNPPPAKPVPITVSIYDDATGGTLLFSESHIVTLDPSRRFEVLLGSITAGGVPAALFTTNSARWIGVQVGSDPEQTPRVMLVSVPYALKAADSDKLGGVPASSYLTEFDPTSANAYTDAQVAAEAAARAAADTTLQSNIDAEAAARAQGDIDTLAAANTYTDSSVAAEAAARSAADTTLQSNIDAEAAARAQGDIDTLAAANTYTDSSVAAEAAARSAADTTLQGNIDAEAAARAAADTTLQFNIDAEAAARSAADSTLQLNIDAEAAARAAADTVLQNNLNTLAGQAITSLTAGTGISISGVANSRTIENTGDTNSGDDITSISGSGGVTVSGSGNARTIGHNTWSCPAGSAVRSIDSTGVVTCETDDVGGGAANADTLDGLDSLQFVRSDVSGSINGSLGVTGSVTVPHLAGGPSSSGFKWSDGTAANTATLTLDGNGPNGLSYQGSATFPCFIVRAVTGTSASGVAMARMCADGTITGSVKSFVEAHPTRADTEIHYASLEGPESAMYLRGSARTGSEPVRIEFPEHFTVLVAGETVTASVTSVGRCPGGLFVAERNGHGMVVARETPDGGACDFDYLVMGVRSRYLDFKVVREVK